MQLSNVKLRGYERNKRLAIKAFFLLNDLAAIAIIIYAAYVVMKAVN